MADNRHLGYDPSPEVLALEKKYFVRTRDEKGLQRRMYQMQLDLLEHYRDLHKRNKEDQKRATLTRRFLRSEIAKLEPMTTEDLATKHVSKVQAPLDAIAA